MIEVRQTAAFRAWFSGLRDGAARKHVVRRMARLATGNFGDAKPVGGKVAELRIDHGPGYRLYFARQGNRIVILLCGGTKRTQARDIDTAKKMAAQLE